MLDGMCAKSVPGNCLTIQGMPILGKDPIRTDLWQKTSGAEDHIHTGIQSLCISEFYCCLALAYFCRQKAH